MKNVIQRRFVVARNSRRDYLAFFRKIYFRLTRAENIYNTPTVHLKLVPSHPEKLEEKKNIYILRVPTPPHDASHYNMVS